MGLLVKATNQTAAAKIGIYGEAGSGKTRTAIEIAIGLARLSKKPIAMFDTEGGSDFMVGLCEKAEVELLVAKARAFADLMAFTKEARSEGAVWIVDSISHTWDDLRESYERKLKRTKGLEIWDWGKIKPAWREFTNEFLTSPCHAIVCGRAASIYEQVYNAEKDKNEVQVVGSKMKTEKETAYEPSLLIEMERRPKGPGAGWDHVAIVVKDRSDTMDGQEFKDPTFKTFAPFFAAINLGGTHNPTDASRNSDHMFASPDNAVERKRNIEITLEKIKDAFTLADIGGQSTADKKRVKQLLLDHFGTSAWSEIEGMRLTTLQEGLTTLTDALTGVDVVPKVRKLLQDAEGIISAEQVERFEAQITDKDYEGLALAADFLASLIETHKNGDAGKVNAKVAAMTEEADSGLPF